MGRGSTDPLGTEAEALASGVSRRTAQRRRKARLVEVSTELVPLGAVGFRFPAKKRIAPRPGAAAASAVEQAIVARLREAIEAGDAPLIKIYSSAWVDSCKCLRVWEEWARTEEKKEWDDSISIKMNAEIGLPAFTPSPFPH